MRRLKLEFLVLLAGELTLSACGGFGHTTRSVVHALNNVHIGFESTIGKLKETTETRALNFADWRKLNVSNDIGEIRVVAGSEKPSLTITKRFYKPENLKFSLETRGDTLMVTGLVKPNFCNNCGIDLTFNIPTGLELHLQSDVGDIAVTGQINMLEAKTDIGTITAEHLGAATVHLQSDTGDVNLNDVQGAVKLESNIGEITVTNLRGSLDLHTDTGDVTAKNINLEPDSSNQLSSNIGTVRLEEFTAPNGIELIGDTNMGDLELGLNEFLVNQSGEFIEQHFTASRDGTHAAKVSLQTDTGTIVARVGN